MKKLISLLAATGLVATTSATVVACNDPADGSTDKVALNTVITVKALGDIQLTGTATVPTNDQILTAAVAKNTKLDKAQVEVSGTPTASKATIKVKSDSKSYVADGTVEVTYTSKPATASKKDISKVTVAISSADTKATAEEKILTAIQGIESSAAETDYTVTWAEGSTVDGSDNLVETKTATVTASEKSTKISGSFTVTVTDKDINLSELSPLLPLAGYGTVKVASDSLSDKTIVLQAVSEHLQKALKSDAAIGFIGSDISAQFTVDEINTLADVVYYSDAEGQTVAAEGVTIVLVNLTVKSDKKDAIAGLNLTGTLSVKIEAASA